MSFVVRTRALPYNINSNLIRNEGPDILYYRDREPVSSATNDGNLASGTSVVLDGTQWLVSAGASGVDILTFGTTTAPNAQTASYTLALPDASRAIEMNSASPLNLTVPPESSANFPVGTIIEVVRIGAGTVTLVPGAGVTLRAPGAVLTLRAQFSVVSLRKRASDDWVVAGDTG